MSNTGVLSDQLHNWSDRNEETSKFCPPATSQGAPAATAGSRPHPSWLAHRTLQAVRQTWLQVCRRARSWPQVLPLGNATPRKAPDGLRSPGLPAGGHSVAGQLPFRSTDFRRDLRDQPRTAPPKGATVGQLHGQRCDTPWRDDRCQRCGNPGRQHASVATRRQSLKCGGAQ